MGYVLELTKAMRMLSTQPYTVFLGQGVGYRANAMWQTLTDVPLGQRIEMPVAEDMQLGISEGMSIDGWNVVSVYPRMDFLVCAMNQLVNHLDKIEQLSRGVYKPKVIIRTMVGSKKPLDAGLQHTGNYVPMLRAGLDNIKVYSLIEPWEIVECYKKAMESDKSSILVEYGELYD